MIARQLYLGRHGIVAPHVVISEKHPLVGMMLAMSWEFDGKHLKISHIGRLLGTRSSSHEQLAARRARNAEAACRAS